MKNFEEFIKINELLASSPADFKNVDKDDKDKEILRLGIVAELDAVSLYEQLAESAVSEKVKNTLLKIAKEEKTHIGELQALLKEFDPEYKKELKKGKEEVKKDNKEEEKDEEEKDEDEKEEDDTVQK